MCASGPSCRRDYIIAFFYRIQYCGRVPSLHMHHELEWKITFSVILDSLIEPGRGWYPMRSTSALFTSRPRRLSRERLSIRELLPVSEAGRGNVDVLPDSAVGSVLPSAASAYPLLSRSVRNATLARFSAVGGRVMSKAPGLAWAWVWGRQRKGQRQKRGGVILYLCEPAPDSPHSAG